MKGKSYLFIIVLLLFSSSILSQKVDSLSQLVYKKRQKTVFLTMGIGYSASTFALNEAWYKDYPRSSFHFFDDLAEWHKMDKIGHVFSANFQSIWAYNLYKWTGIEEDRSILYGALTSVLFQSTIEVLDGFSTEWGFSVYDFGSNVIGASLFAFQQKKWKEQRIIMKVSGQRRDYSDRSILSTDGSSSVLLQDRADDLYGNTLASRILKDYNGQIIWASTNLKSMFPQSRLPNWLNVAVGYGAENMYGGFENAWSVGDQHFVVPDVRYGQFYLSPDIDFSRIKTNKKGLKMLFDVLNIIKFPLPGLELNTNGKLVFHPISY